MQKRRFFRAIAVFLPALIVAAGLLSIPASAGLSQTQISMITGEGELNLTEWYNPNDDLTLEDGALLFSEDSNEETRLISKSSAAADKYYKDLIEISATIRFTEIAAGQSFILAAGLSGLEALPGDAGNVEVQFKNNGGITAQVVVYSKDGEAVTVVPEKRCGSMGSEISATLHISVSGMLELTVGGNRIGSAQLSDVPEGQAGIMQTGRCLARVSELKATTYSYNRPENTDACEDFESGTLNANAFTSVMITAVRPLAGIQVEELNGNKVLMFRNAKVGYFGTKYEYSNFEVSFDVPYISRKNVYDENGTLITAPNGEFGLSFGDVGVNLSGEDYDQSTDLILFTGPEVQGWFSKWKCSLKEQSFYQPDIDTGFSVRITMVDSLMTLSMKGLSDSSWKEMQTYTYGRMNTGAIKIWSTRDTNFAIDNFKVKNLDQDANVTEVDFKSGVISQPDYTYTAAEKVYKEDSSVETEKPFNWMIIVLYAAAAGVVIIGAGVAVNLLYRRKANGKEKALK